MSVYLIEEEDEEEDNLIPVNMLPSCGERLDRPAWQQRSADDVLNQDYWQIQV